MAYYNKRSDEEVVNRQRKYPRQIASCIHHTQTLCVECELSAPHAEDTKPVPFLTMHGGYSRFVLTLVDTSGSEPKFVTVNLRAAECADIFERFRIAYSNLLIGNQPQGNDDDTPSLAYTVTLKTGRDKGKTPASILMENPENVKSLRDTAEWLQKHVDRYPTNREIIDAINDAIALMEAGLLDAEQTVANQAKNITVFNAGYKVQRGGKEHAAVKIDCDITRDNPWVFEVENADITGNDPEKPENWKNLRRITMCLNCQEMSYVIRQMERILTYFENMWFYDLYNQAETVAQEQRASWSSQQ